MIRHLLIIGNYTFVFLVEKNSIQVTPPDELKGKYECAIRNFGCCSTGARCMAGSSTPSPTVRGARASTSSTSPSSLRKPADAPTSSSLTVEVMMCANDKKRPTHIGGHVWDFITAISILMPEYIYLVACRGWTYIFGYCVPTISRQKFTRYCTT